MFNTEYLIEIVIVIIGILFALTFHEFAHGYVAYRLGDPTAKNYGRLTLNPVKHLDPLGTILLVLSFILYHAAFGWAKPVPFNPAYFRDTKKGTALVGLAGPVANVLLAFAAMLLMKIFNLGNPTHDYAIAYLSFFLQQLIIINISLAVFNLIPVPPLDGSKIFISVMPPRVYYKILQYENYGIMIVMLLMFTGVLSRVINVISFLITKGLGLIVDLLPI